MCARARSHTMGNDVKKFKNKPHIPEYIRRFNEQVSDFSHIFNLPSSAPEFKSTKPRHAHVSISNIEFEDPCES